MPGEPKFEKEDEQGVLTMTYSAETENILVSVTEISFSDGASMTDDTEQVEILLNGFFSGVEEGLKAEGDYEAGDIEEIEFAGMTGKEQMVWLSGAPMLSRGIPANGRLYFIGVMAPDEVQIKKIVDSFKVNEPKKASAAK